MFKYFFLFLIALIFFVPKEVFAHSQTQVIEMTERGFSPDPVTLEENSTIIFINKDQVAHWPASNVHPTHDLYPEFDPQKGIEPGQSWAFRPKRIGAWKYHDHLFPHLRGTINVVSEASTQNDKQITFPPRRWEARLEQVKELISRLLKQLQNLVKFNKKVSTPDPAKFISSSYADQQKILEGLDAKQGWEFVKTTFKDQSGSAGNIHDLAHLSGGLIYEKNGFLELGSCSADFAFGCYHGFLDKAFAKNLDNLLDAQDACSKLGPGNSGPVASCIHGIGHGVASFYSGKDLEKSLSSCRKLTSGSEYCFDGVFMEFVRSAPEDFFKKEDPYYPCDQLEQKFGYAYSFACGRNQSALLMSRFKLGFEKVVSVCLNSSSKPFQEACFDSLGFSLASSADVEKIIAGCRVIGESEFVSRCIKSAAGELVFQEVPNWYEKSKLICEASSLKDECLQNVDRLIKEYNKQVKINFAPKNPQQDLNSYIREQMMECYKVGGRDGCYKSVAQILYDQLGLSKMMQLLKANEAYPEVYARCHEVTHYLSRLEYEKEKSIAKVYAQCDSTCHGGCYHGTLEAYLKENPNTDFAKICGKREDYQKPIEFNECLHGMGHAAMFVLDMELKESLKLCDTFKNPEHVDRCYTGVFMENSSSSTSFDHKSKYVKTDDPFYPCNSLEEKYQSTCWQYQSSYFSILNHQDWMKVSNMCMQIPQNYQDKCFRTIGTNQVGFTTSLQTMKADCDLMPDDHFKDICVSGVVSSLAYRFVGETQKMIDFCSLVNLGNKESCFKQIGTGLLDWSANKDLARQNCQKIKDLKGASWCLSVI